MGVEQSAPFLLFAYFSCIILKITNGDFNVKQRNHYL